MDGILLCIYKSYRDMIIDYDHITLFIKFIEAELGIDSIEEVRDNVKIKKSNVFYVAYEIMTRKLEVSEMSFINEFFYIIQWLYNDVLNKGVPKEVYDAYNEWDYEYEKLHFEDLLKLGFRKEEIITELLEIDNTTMPRMTGELAGNHDVWCSRVFESPRNLYFLMYRNKIVAYLDMGPLTKKNHKETLKGILDETKIDAIKPEPNNMYPFYLTIITTLKEHRAYITLGILIEMFFEKIEEFARKKIIIEELFANAYTDEGEILCKMFGMQHVCNHKCAGKVYYIKLFPMHMEHKFIKKYPEIYNLYSEFEKNYKKDKFNISKLFNK